MKILSFSLMAEACSTYVDVVYILSCMYEHAPSILGSGSQLLTWLFC